ncbi:hypothetical protein K490DRAFT_71769 [Saccharata proteae CBS 121410]|uniref:Rsm22-domain-containing protein n=1 Tax=Saccharata proteae CBS 121410 TaxID=1314787 RepID=A0A9P4I1E1_9PEZI|nr:hypothetical protein K490DRAFT_71769 [Saccharata proteae CBS 121410]
MLTARPLQQFICKSCRSKAIAATASRRLDASNRALSTTATTHFSKRLRLERPRRHPSNSFSTSSRSRDDTAARNTYRDVLPTGHLDAEEYFVYERLYGAPLRIAPEEELFPEEPEEADEEPIGPIENTLFIEDEKGRLKQVSYYVGGKEETPESAQDGQEVVHEAVDAEDVVSEEPGVEEAEAEEEEEEEYWPGDERMRRHPLTVAGKFATFPSTLTLPESTFVKPVSNILSVAANKHLRATAEHVFGGHRFPHSTATPTPPGGGLEQKPIPLNTAQGKMSPMESNSYIAAIMPGTYASVMSILVEVRKRLGSAWLESLLQKEGGPLILDAGSAGAGVIAFREVLQAEWERMQEEAGTSSDKKPAPLGKASVLTGSDTLRIRVSKLLDDTTFIPRLPDAVVPGEKVGPKHRKVYDVIVAPHTLWNLKEDFLRKAQVQKLWSLLNPDGGVLILMEKGLPRGFEVVAGARALLLDNYISSPGAEQFETPLQDSTNQSRYTQKETGMIVAPCTNHSACPMLVVPGVSRHRKDFCYFQQRYIRPPFLQNLISGKGSRNYENVQFSYLAVQRGRDLRAGENGVEQGESGADRAFEGYGEEEHEEFEAEEGEEVEEGVEVEEGKEGQKDPELEEVPHAEPTTASTTPVSTLSFPRLILPAIKRRGHVMLDVCTPAGRLERWTVTKGRGRRAYRDARKAQWGDLWALGAKTRVTRNVRLGELGKKSFGKGEGKKRGKGGVDGYGRSVKRGRESRKEQRMRTNEEREFLDED